MVENIGLIITFTVLNSLVVIYAFILIIYGKFFRKNEFLYLVNKNIKFNIIFIIQANIGDNEKAIPRIEESIRAPNDKNTHADEKTIQLIES